MREVHRQPALAVTAASVLTHNLAAADARDAMTPRCTTSLGALALMALITTLAPAGFLCNRVCAKIAPYGMHDIPDQLFHTHSSVS